MSAIDTFNYANGALRLSINPPAQSVVILLHVASGAQVQLTKSPLPTVDAYISDLLASGLNPEEVFDNVSQGYGLDQKGRLKLAQWAPPVAA